MWCFKYVRALSAQLRPKYNTVIINDLNGALHLCSELWKINDWRESAFIIAAQNALLRPNYAPNAAIMVKLSNPHPWVEPKTTELRARIEFTMAIIFTNLGLPLHVTLLPPTLIYLYCYLIPPRDLPRRANAPHERVTHPIALGQCASPKYFKFLACRYIYWSRGKKQIIWAPPRERGEKEPRAFCVCALLSLSDMCLKYTWALYNYAAATAAVLCVNIIYTHTHTRMYARININTAAGQMATK